MTRVKTLLDEIFRGVTFGVPDGGSAGSVSSSISMALSPEKWYSGPNGLKPIGS